MYHRFVRRLAQQNFDLVNSKNYEKLLASCSPTIHHRFGGNHALGGERHDVEALRLWFERLGRLVPTLHLEIRDVWSTGTPWNTTLIIRWDSAGKFPDGSPYTNHGVHIITLQWGKATSIDANEDSQTVDRLLIALTAAGITEAAASPITS